MILCYFIFLCDKYLASRTIRQMNYFIDGSSPAQFVIGGSGFTAINHGFQPIRGEHCSSVVALDLFIKFARSTAVILNEARCVTIIVDTSKLTNVKW
jgi:hypothetical protein